MPDLTTILGIVAALCTTASYAPQVWKVWQTKSAEDLSFKMLGLLSFGLLLWACYGFVLEDPVIIIANLVSLSMALFLLGFKYFSERSGGRS